MSHHLELFDPLIRVAGEAVWERYAGGQVVWHASPYRDTLGFDAMFASEEIDEFRRRLHPDDVARVQARQDADEEHPGDVWADEYRLRRDDGTYANLMIRGFTLPPGADPTAPLTVGTVRDVTAEREVERRLRHEATHDALTGLANRSLLQEKLTDAIKAAEADERPVALLDLDLDRFKIVNDGFGHPYGDKVIQAVSARLRTLVGPQDIVVRMGGDEFVILVPFVDRVEAIHEMAQRLVDSFTTPFEVEGRQIHLTGSIGVSFFPRDGRQGAELIDNADMAMYYAKAAGRSAFRVFAPVMAEEAQRRTDMETHLRSAAADGQLWLAFQPKVDLASGQVTGCEALLRWNHPERGPVTPAEFIPVAEESGMILQIGDWVLDAACRQGRAWLDEGMAPMTIAVNICAAQLLQPDPVAWVTATLERTGFPADLLELELTESQLSQDVETTINVIRRLRQLGVKIAIDDFGTGYSSLEYLRRFDVTSLKIDRSFVDGMLAESSDEAIVRAAIALGGAFGISVTAEGVETEAQQRFLSELRCDEMQGFLVSKPVAAIEFSALLTDSWAIQV